MNLRVKSKGVGVRCNLVNSHLEESQPHPIFNHYVDRGSHFYCIFCHSPRQRHLLRFSSACSITQTGSLSWFALASFCTWPLVRVSSLCYIWREFSRSFFLFGQLHALMLLELISFVWLFILLFLQNEQASSSLNNDDIFLHLLSFPLNNLLVTIVSMCLH